MSQQQQQQTQQEQGREQKQAENQRGKPAVERVQCSPAIKDDKNGKDFVGYSDYALKIAQGIMSNADSLRSVCSMGTPSHKRA
jgi:hypothetical protein